MSRLRVTIEVDENGQCRSEMTFRGNDLEGEGSSPSEALQSLAEQLALYENEEDAFPEEARLGHVLQSYS